MNSVRCWGELALGRYANLTNKMTSVFYNFEMEVGVVTPVSPETPHLYKPHGLSPSDPYYLNPVRSL